MEKRQKIQHSYNLRNRNNGSKSKNDFANRYLLTENEESEAIINILNDDCLKEIFRYLSIFEKVKIERVCKRWRSVSQDSWNTFKRLDDNFFINPKFYNDNIKNVRTIAYKVLSLGGKFIRVVDINPSADSLLISYEYVLNFLSQFSENIEIFIFNNEKLCKHSSEFEKALKHLKLLFSKNKNLKCISMPKIEITGELLLGLPFKSVEKIDLCFRIGNSDNLNLAFSQLVNLNSCKIDSDYRNIEIILKEIATDKNNIVYLGMDQNLRVQGVFSFGPNFSKYFLKLKKLKELELNFIDIRKEELIWLPINSIEKLILNNCDYVTNTDYKTCLPKFVNLKEIKLRDKKINDQFCEILLKCKQLKSIVLHSNPCPMHIHLNLSNVGVLKLSKLPYLESLNIVSPTITDAALSELTHLKELIIAADITSEGLSQFIEEAQNLVHIVIQRKYMKCVETENLHEIVSKILSKRNKKIVNGSHFQNDLNWYIVNSA